MKRKLVEVLIGAIITAYMLSGCGSTAKQTATESTGTSEVAETDKKLEQNTTGANSVMITYACWDSNQAKFIRTIADEFESENPDIKIDIQVNGWSDYWVMLEAAATGGSLPDTFWMHSNNIYYYGANNQLMDLTDYIQSH